MIFGHIADREHYGLTLYAAAATEPIPTADAKLHLRVDISDDDDYIASLVKAARAQAENILGRRLVTQTWDLTRDCFPIGDRELMIPYGPVQSISSISYIDSGGTTQTLSSANYVLDTASLNARVYPAYSLIWPLTRDIQNAVTIRYVTGFGAYTAVPANIICAMKLMIGHWYENRENSVLGESVMQLPLAAEALLSAERTSWL